MTKSQALAALQHKLSKGEFTPREAAAISLVDRIVVDAHSVDDAALQSCAGTSAMKKLLNWSARAVCLRGPEP
jgi:hypothetical protein